MGHRNAQANVSVAHLSVTKKRHQNDQNSTLNKIDRKHTKI